MLDKRTPQSRRFSMVHSADVVISIEGGGGTNSAIDVALAIERPVLPLPFGEPGASRDAWEAQRDDILNWFRIDALEAEEFENTKLATLDQSQVHDLAKRVCAVLMRGFTQGIFVIMPFRTETDRIYTDAIVPALGTYGFQPWRTDRTVVTGDMVDLRRRLEVAVATLSGKT